MSVAHSYQLNLKQPQYLSQAELNSMLDRSNAFSTKKQSKIELMKAQMQSEEDAQIYPTPHISDRTNQIGINLISKKICSQFWKYAREIHFARETEKMEYYDKIQ